MHGEGGSSFSLDLRLSFRWGFDTSIDTDCPYFPRRNKNKSMLLTVHKNVTTEVDEWGGRRLIEKRGQGIFLSSQSTTSGLFCWGCQERVNLRAGYLLDLPCRRVCTGQELFTIAWPAICPKSLIEKPAIRYKGESCGMRRLRSVLLWSRHNQARKLKLLSAVNPLLPLCRSGYCSKEFQSRRRQEMRPDPASLFP